MEESGKRKQQLWQDLKYQKLKSGKLMNETMKGMKKKVNKDSESINCIEKDY